MKHDYQKLATKIQRILVDEWDPIGSSPDDEYDSYIPVIYKLLQLGRDEYKLAAHLEQLETNSMGLSANSGRCEHAAKLLRQLI